MPETILKSPPLAGVATTRRRLFVLQPNSQCPSVDQEHVWCTLVSDLTTEMTRVGKG